MQRVRDNSSSMSSVGYATQYNAEGAVIIGPTSYPISVSQTDVMVDIVTPGFAQRRARGEIIVSPMSKVRKTVGFAHMAQQWTRSDGIRAVYTGDWDIGLGGYDPFSFPEVSVAKSKSAGLAITDAYAAVGSPDVASLTELAEFKETLAFLYSPVKGMVTLSQRFKRHLNRVTEIENRFASKLARWEKLPPKIRAKRERPVMPKLPIFSVGRFKGSDVASSWLAYRYGLMPLIYTFQDIEKLLKKRLESPSTRATARAKDNRVVSIDNLTDVPGSWGPCTYREVTSTNGQVTIATRAGVLYVPDLTLSAQLGVQWNRVPAALYEAIPLSFVTDWFHNGSKLYDAITAEYRSLDILGAWVSQTIEYSIVRSTEIVPVSNCSVSGGRTTQAISGKWKSRTPATLADVEFFLRVELNSKRIADGLALIYSFLATARKH